VKILKENFPETIVLIEKVYEIEEDHYVLFGKDQKGVSWRIDTKQTPITLLLEE